MLGWFGLHGVVANSGVGAIQPGGARLRPRVEVIPNGVDGNGLFSRERARGLLNVGDRNVLIAGIGSLVPNKNFGLLIEVLAQLHPRWPSLRLVLIGDGPEKQRLVRMAAERMLTEYCDFTGQIPEARRLLRGTDILCVPSISEAMPNVVMEACAAGVPVVAHNTGAIESLVRPGVNGFIVGPANESSFTDAVERLVSDEGLRRRMGDAGQHLMQSVFSVEHMADHFVAFYREVAKP